MFNTIFKTSIKDTGCTHAQPRREAQQMSEVFVTNFLFVIRTVTNCVKLVSKEQCANFSSPHCWLVLLPVSRPSSTTQTAIQSCVPRLAPALVACNCDLEQDMCGNTTDRIECHSIRSAMRSPLFEMHAATDHMLTGMCSYTCGFCSL